MWSVTAGANILGRRVTWDVQCAHCAQGRQFYPGVSNQGKGMPCLSGVAWESVAELQHSYQGRTDCPGLRTQYTDPGCQAMPRLCLDPPCNHLCSGKPRQNMAAAESGILKLPQQTVECLLSRTLAVRRFGFPHPHILVSHLVLQPFSDWWYIHYIGESARWPVRLGK